MGHRFIVQSGRDRIFKIMMCRQRTLFADGEISVIHTAVIHLVEATIAHDEDGGLRSGGDVSHSDKCLFRIDYCVALNGKLMLVFACNFHRVCRIRRVISGA
jgi:hypothetical protein